MAHPLLTQRAVVLAEIESTFNVDPVPLPATDAMLVGQPNFAPDITQLTRDVVRRTLSPLSTKAGRKIAQMTFTHEVRSNGNSDGTISPTMGVLLRACGMSQTAITTGAANTIGDARAKVGNTGTITWAKTTTYTGIVRRTFKIACTTGGGSGVAQVTISSPAVGAIPAESLTGVVLTDSSAVDLFGTTDAQITPTIGTALVVGDEWYVDVIPTGFEYAPVSEAFDSCTIYMYLDGLLHIMTGARGTFTVDCPGGQFGVFTFTMQGTYIAPTDAAMPAAPAYESQQPPQVELAGLNVAGDAANFCASRWQIDIANNVVPRDCVNDSDAFQGVMITGRQPTASMDPEATLVAEHDFWGNLASGAELWFGAKVGTVQGEIVNFSCPNVQYTNLAYGDRESIRTFDVTMNLSTSEVDLGDNELLINFS